MDNTLSFDKAYQRLEEILEIFNSEQLPLEQALKVYEEADKLIQLCTEKLASAEQKVQVLIKSRQGEEPSLEEFSPSQEQYLNRKL
ncbi:MAG: exodeoxyribonuclease VII small subunit [Chlamydiae bacterium]|nr:exodeoxyribonuclease VII small subunit [Chlamydiota bacterium]